MRKRLLTLALVLAALISVVTLSGQAQENGEALILQKNETAVTLTADTVVDLNGYSIETLTIENSANVTVKDSQTDDYDAENGRGYGKITNITGGEVSAADGYLLVDDDGFSAHRLELTVSGVSFRATDLTENGAGMYYQCTFGGDQVVKETVTAYGVAMGAGKQPDFRDKTFTRNADMDSWATGTAFTGNSTLLKGIMRTGNAYSINKRNSDIDVHCQAYVELADGSRITGESKILSIRELVEGNEITAGVDRKWDSLDDTKKTTVQNFYNTFYNIVSAWSVPQIRQSVTGGPYQICIPQDMKILHDKPDAEIELATDIDMKDVEFTPVPSFSGTFDGNNYSIYNLHIDSNTAAYGDYMGMFLWLEETAVVRDLDLEYITVDASATGARFIGTIAGRNDGQVLDCTVTGTIIDDQPGEESRLIFVGAMVGRAGDNSVTRGEPILFVKDTVTDVNGNTVTYRTDGLCAKVKMNVPDSPHVMKRLVGNFSATNVTYSGDWQDLSFSTEDDSALVQSRRQEAVSAMQEMATFKWTVPNLNGTSSDPDLIHYGTTDTSKQNSHIHTQKFYDGTVYYGIPYDHTSSSYEQAMFYMDEGANGVYVLNDVAASSGNSTWQITQKDAFNNNAYIGFTKYIGNDCSGAVAWAWHHAAPRYVKGGGVYVLLSTNTMPNDAAEETYGIYRVGPYTVTDDMTAEIDGKDVVTSPAVAEANGLNTMYESYARTQMGDGLMYGEPGGHVRMAAADSVVIRNKNGSIYGAKSYILIHEQGDGLYDRATTNSSWRINYKYTFYDLFYGKTKSSGSGYLPITLKAFHDDTVAMLYSAPYEYTNATDTQKITTPGLGQINAGNRILSATVVVKDSSGKVVYEKTAFKGENGVYNTYRSTYLTMMMKYYFSDYVDYVESGKTYTFSVDCTVAGGTLNADGTISNTTTNVIKDRSFTAA